MENEPQDITQVSVGDGELYAIRSASATVYFVDLDRALLLRAPGPGSSTGPFDGVWLRLVKIESEADAGVIQVGRRHRYTMDPDPTGPGDLIWWIQRTVTAIEPVPPELSPQGRRPEQGEYTAPFGH